jgi:hypothetical protein
MLWGRIEFSGFCDLLKHLRKPRYHYRADGVPKLDYKSEDTAEKSAKRMSEKTGQSFDWYQCPKCKGWHIGKDSDL